MPFHQIYGVEINYPGSRDALWGLVNDYTYNNSCSVHLAVRAIKAQLEANPPKVNSETLCACQACRGKRRDGGLPETHIVHDSDFAPRSWRRLALDGDVFPYHIGVELETSINSNIRDYLANDAAAALRRPKQLWLAKRDGSVSGPEFVSHPATLTYWQSISGDLQSMFKMLVHAGYASHNGGRAGMHVNIAKKAFSTPQHLYDFLRLITENETFAIKMSQRTYEQVSHWAKFRSYTMYDAERMFNGSAYVTQKYSVVNAPAGGRFEFRLPRGTLRIDRFLKNLEWTAAMIGYTRGLEGVAPTVPDFAAWVQQAPDLYENLVRFMREKRSELSLTGLV